MLGSVKEGEKHTRANQSQNQWPLSTWAVDSLTKRNDGGAKFNKELDLKNEQTEMNNIVTEMKKYTRRNQYQDKWGRKVNKWVGRQIDGNHYGRIEERKKNEKKWGQSKRH